ncbi:hypothetical protein BGX38DRAFT_1182174, partial [Terfezia claveryi]
MVRVLLVWSPLRAGAVRTGYSHIREMRPPFLTQRIGSPSLSTLPHHRTSPFSASVIITNAPPAVSFPHVIRCILHIPRGGWAVKIGNILEEGWRICFTDGTGRGGHTASLFSEDWRGTPFERTRVFGRRVYGLRFGTP